MFLRRFGDLDADGSNEPVFTLPACAQMMVGPWKVVEQARRRRVGAHPPLPVGLHAHDPARAEAQERMARSTVTWRGAHDSECAARRRPVALDVPAHLGEHAVPGRGQRR